MFKQRSQQRRNISEFIAVGQAHLRQYPLRPIGEPDQHPTPVLGALPPLNEAVGNKPVDEFDGGVMPNLKTVREESNGDVSPRHGFDGQQCLVLLGTEPRPGRCALAELQETA
jgi:hypothetical protein